MMRRIGVTKRGLLAALFACLVGIALQGSPLPAQAQSAPSVRLVIDYGDGVLKIYERLPWSKGNTVLDVLNAAKTSPHGITFTSTGAGATAFLTQLDGVQNEGGGSAAKNWQFWVNTTYADKSFGIFEVQAADTVFWRFATFGGK